MLRRENSRRGDSGRVVARVESTFAVDEISGSNADAPRLGHCIELALDPSYSGLVYGLRSHLSCKALQLYACHSSFTSTS